MRNHLRPLHCSCRTEQQYLFRARRFILLHGKRQAASGRPGGHGDRGVPHAPGASRMCGYDIRPVQELLKRKDVRSTPIHTRAMRKGANAVLSPMER